MEGKRVLIVEDEMIIAESISDMLEEMDFEVQGIQMRARSAFESLQKNTPDLVLLDINLKGEEDGIWLAEQIRDSLSVPYLFLTSYGDRKTIDKAISSSPYGYLLKPVEKQNLYAGIMAALERFKHDTASDLAEARIFEDHFFIKDNFEYVRVEMDDIGFIKADDNYLEVITSQRKHIIRSTLKEFTKNLPSNQFVQTHRSYVINRSKVESFSQLYLMVQDQKVPISKNFQKDVLAQFQKLG